MFRIDIAKLRFFYHSTKYFAAFLSIMSFFISLQNRLFAEYLPHSAHGALADR